MTMSGHVHERLSAYLDRELGAAESASVAAHLGDCEPCRQHLEALATVDQTARVLTAEPPEGYFDALPGRVRARLEASPGRLRSVPAARRPARLPAWTWALAATLVLAVITPLTLLRSRSVATSPEEAAVVSKVAPSTPPLAAATAAPIEAARDLSDEPRADASVLRERPASAGARAPAPAKPLATPRPDPDDLRRAAAPPVAAEPQRAKPQERKLAGPGGPYQGQVQSQGQAVQDKDGAPSRAKAEPPQTVPAQLAGAATESLEVTARPEEAEALSGTVARKNAAPPATGGTRALAKGDGARQRSSGFAEAAPPQDEGRLSPEETAYRGLLAPTPATRAALRERREA